MKPDAFPGRLSPLQADLLRQLGLEGGEGFFLTGGSALIGYYGHDRLTRDLDLFSRSEDSFADGPAWLSRAAEAVGAQMQPIRTTPGFRRYRVARGDEVTVVDLVLESVPAVHPPHSLSGTTLHLDAPEEIAINKVCALVGRGEPRDLEDLLFLAQRGIDLDRAVDEAVAKDAGVGIDTLLLTLPAVPIQGSQALMDFREAWLKRLRLGLLPPESGVNGPGLGPGTS